VDFGAAFDSYILQFTVLVMFDIALQLFMHERLRFVITLAGVAFAVQLVLVQVGLFLGLLDKASVTIANLRADLWVTAKNTPTIDFAHGFPENYVNRVRSVPGVELADNLIVGYLFMTLPAGNDETVIVYAMENFERWQFPWKVTNGRLGDLRRGDFIFLDGSAERRFGRFAIGEYREVFGKRMRIIGRTEEALSFTTTPIAFAEFSRVQALLHDQIGHGTHYIVVRVAPGVDCEAVRQEIQRRLPYNDVFTRDEWMEKSRRYWVETTGIGLNMVVTVFLGCVVGIMVVALTLYTSAIEHLREFATMKAIGATNAYIYTILAAQASVAAIAGFVLGGLCTFLAKPVFSGLGLNLMLSTVGVIDVFVGTWGLCIGAAVLAYRKIAGTDPALVFRT
jgi:putative ABC transport system permease protein